MRDGTYRISNKREVKVVEVYQNRTHLGSVETLFKNGYSFEEVEVLTKEELEKLKGK